MPVKSRTCQSVQGILRSRGWERNVTPAVAINLVDCFLWLGRKNVVGDAVAGRSQMAAM